MTALRSDRLYQPSSTATRSSSRMTSSSSPSTLTSVPEYLPNSTLSPALTAIGRTLPSSWILPVPTATTSPLIGFSVAVSGMTMPPADLVSASRRLMMTRSCNGRSFMTNSSCVGLKGGCVVSTQQRRVPIVGPENRDSRALGDFSGRRRNRLLRCPDGPAPALPLHLPGYRNRGADRPHPGRGTAGGLREPAAGRGFHLPLAGRNPRRRRGSAGHQDHARALRRPARAPGRAASLRAAGTRGDRNCRGAAGLPRLAGTRNHRSVRWRPLRRPARILSLRKLLLNRRRGGMHSTRGCHAP